MIIGASQPRARSSAEIQFNRLQLTPWSINPFREADLQRRGSLQIGYFHCHLPLPILHLFLTPDWSPHRQLYSLETRLFLATWCLSLQLASLCVDPAACPNMPHFMSERMQKLVCPLIQIAPVHKLPQCTSSEEMLAVDPANRHWFASDLAQITQLQPPPSPTWGTFFTELGQNGGEHNLRKLD